MRLLIVNLTLFFTYFHQMDLLEESVESAQKREETIRMYHAMKDALSIIGEVSSSAMSTSLSSNALNSDYTGSNG